MGEGEPQPLTGEYPEPNASAPLDTPVHNCFSHLKATVHPCAIKDGNDDDEESHMGQTKLGSLGRAPSLLSFAQDGRHTLTARQN